MDILNTENISGATTNMVCINSVKDFVIQNELISGSGNSVSVKYYGSVYPDAETNSDEKWVDITNFLFGSDTIVCDSKTVRSMAIISRCAICMLKVVATPSLSVAANNTVKIAVGF